MKKSKILLTVILCLAMVLTMFNGVVFATETTEDVTPVVNYGAASIEGDTIHLMENAPAVIAFTSAQNWDIVGYQYSEARPEGLDIQDETPLEEDSLVPTYRFGNLTAGTYEFTLTISENENYETVYQKTYTLDVKAVDQGPTYGDAKDYVSGKLTDVKNFYANGNNVTIVEENGKTIAKVAGCPDIVLSEGSWYVYAGGVTENASYDTVTITMEGGNVANIIGSNKVAGSIQTSNIVIKNGTVGMVIANRGGTGSGAPSYDKRTDYSVGTANITISGGTFQAVAGTYGYTYTENVNMNVSGGYFSAKTSPTQTGIVLGGTNGEVKNATLTMTGGETVGVCLGQRTMISEKATLDIQGGTVGNIYAGSYYNGSENSSNSWWFNQIGNVNYGMAAALDIKIGAEVSYNDIFAGFQFYPDELAKFEETYAAKNPSHPAIANKAYANAAVRVNLFAKPEEDFVPSEIDQDNTSLLKAVGLPNLTVTDHTIEPDLPVVDPSEPVEDVTVGVDAEVGKEVLNSQVNAIINAVQQEGTGATLTGVVSNDETPVAEKIAEAIEAGKNITTEVVVEPVEENAVSAQDKELIAGLAENATIAQYLNLNVVLKAGDEVIGTITQLPEAITYIILIPEELINDNTAFYVVRVHDGAADRLELTHVSDNQYSFTTDRYSTYALAYEVKEDTSSSETPSSSEVSSTETSSSEAGLDSSSEATTGSSSESGTDAPNTGDSNWLPMLLMLVMGAAALTMILVRRRAESK